MKRTNDRNARPSRSGRLPRRALLVGLVTLMIPVTTGCAAWRNRHENEEEAQDEKPATVAQWMKESKRPKF